MVLLRGLSVHSSVVNVLSARSKVNTVVGRDNTQRAFVAMFGSPAPGP